MSAKRLLNVIIVSLIVFNVEILATNESQNDEKSEPFNLSQTTDNSESIQIDVNNNGIHSFEESLPQMTNQSIDSNIKLMSITPDVSQTLQTLNESVGEDNNATLADVIKLNSTQESKVNCTPINSYSVNNQVRHHF